MRDYTLVDEDGVWSVGVGDAVLKAQPLFESPVRIGFASVQTFRSDGSLALADRFNLSLLFARKRYVRELKSRDIDMPEGALLALCVAVSDSQRTVLGGSPGHAFEHSNNHVLDVPRDADDLADAAAELLKCENILDRVGATVVERGYAGDTLPVQLVFVAIVARSLKRPLNVAIVCDAAAGKNATIDAAKELHPPEAVFEIRSGSSKVIVYTDADYEHRVVLFAEADSIPDEGPAASAIRSLAADNYLAYDVVEQDPDTKKYSTRHIVKPGPTGLLTTSTRSLAHQLSTRVLEIGLPDDVAQTRNVMHAHAARVQPRVLELPSLDPWHAYGRYIAIKATELEGVNVPFAHVLANQVPARAVRMRRDFRQLLTVIEACALMRITQRTIMGGWLVATLEDYRAARDLLLPVFDTLAAEGVTSAIRQTVLAIAVDETNVSQATLAQRLELSPATVSWRVGRALEGGWLTDEAPPRTRKKLLRRGAPLPEEVSALPTAEDLTRLFECSNASRGGDGHSAAHALPRADDAVLTNWGRA
jgi:hypothetical protein